MYLWLSVLAVGGGYSVWRMLLPPPTIPASVVAPKHPDVLLLAAVAKVSVDASTLLLSAITGFGMDEPFTCVVARRLTGQQDVPVSSLKHLNDECAFGTMIRRTTRPVFDDIVQSQSLPRAAFAFDAYVGSGDKEWHTLGLFADAGTCNGMMESAISLGIGVRSCHPWTPRF